MLLLILVACDTPTFAYRDVPVQRVQVGKSTFDVRVKGGQAQAIRINSEWAPNWSYTAARFHTAFEVASGCKVRSNSMVGDQALMEATLNCPGTRPATIPRRHGGFECYQTQAAILCEEVVPLATP